jgi:coniferyl-aldehyde dehydrogenase
MQEIFKRQQEAFLKEGFVSAQTRIDRLERAYRMIGLNQKHIIEACNDDFGNHSRHQAQMSEVLAAMTGMKHASTNVKAWMKGERRKVAFPMNLLGAKARVEFQPKGVIGNLSTWNFPVYTALSPLAGIFAAGNRAMLKLSELAPQTAALLQSLISDYFADAECAVITGGPEVGAEFAAMPFDHLIFTGGTNIGRSILQSAAQNLTPVTLELGGKSPVIVGRSYDTVKAAERIMTGKALNMGQACLAPDYCFVPRDRKDEFVAAVTEFFSTIFPTILDNPDYTSVINKRHYDRLNGLVDDAREKGAEVVEVNPASEDFSKQKPGLHRMPMTLIVEPSDDLRVMQEELFGSILCIKTYDDVAECIHYINSRPRPLGLYYFGNDPREEQRVLSSTISGGVTINDVMTHSSCDDLPFGGIGNSGMGSYHGRDGFLTFSHTRAVFRQTKLDLMKLAGMLPPYGKKCEDQLDKLTRIS